MAQEVIMPKWGLTMKEGKIVRWLKSEGDQVEAGEPLFEVETDKITNSVEAPASGVLAQIIVPEGEVAEVQSVLAIIAAPGENPEKVEGGAAPVAERPESVQEVSAKPGDERAPAQGEEFVRAMPAARKLAEELGVSLASVTGTGPDGAIVMKDVQAAADAVFADVNASPKAIEFARKKGVDLTHISGTGEGGRITKADILRAMNPAAESPAEPSSFSKASPETSVFVNKFFPSLSKP